MSDTRYDISPLEQAGYDKNSIALMIREYRQQNGMCTLADAIVALTAQIPGHQPTVVEKLAQANERVTKLEEACRYAIRYIIREYANTLWKEHPSYNLEKARYEAETNPPEIALQLRAALAQEGGQ